MKKILLLFVQPFKFFASRNFAEKTAIYFSKHRYMIYVLSLVITLFMIFLIYIIPNL
ncbi:MAG: hypothetical protein RBT45_04615 [Acholeplasmataceae bacterium]|nr:hypothetical protein [Acholeplasmataceae bacterium]